MNKDGTKGSGQSKAVDQLSNTVALMSCGLLDFVLLGGQNDGKTLSDIRIHFLEILYSLEQARSLMDKLQDEAVPSRLDRINELIEEIAAQTNLLALDIAIKVTHPSQGWAFLASQVNALAARACEIIHEILQFIQENQAVPLTEAWPVSWNHPSSLSASHTNQPAVDYSVNLRANYYFP